MNQNIPKDIFPYFVEISEKLWSGHATIMIGAGFSRNATKNSTTKKEFPTWDDLGDIFLKKLYGHSSKDEKYLNVLKLANEIEATFGRNTLEDLLKTEIPDKEYQPSLLHERVLQLPWNDVFTTNFDTLLERAAEKIVQQRYEPVINKEDLILSTKPRIIKLHGSFPSERPLIITEEDYRQYPIRFAPFVNTVQQSLIENTLCLVGFSGDDPNFLKWIGWIRDNLGKENSLKIYLIGILNLSIGQKRLFENRNIVPLDLSKCDNIDGDHTKALSIFFDFLHEQGRIKNNLDWPENNIHFSFNDKKDLLPQIISVIENWKEIRNEYPNWLIVPEENRSKLLSYTDDIFIQYLSDLEPPYDILFLYEYNWRIEKFLSPIVNSLIEHYENVINRYNPFPHLLEIEGSITTNNEDIKWKEIELQWIELQFSLLRYYREEGFHQKWEFLKERLDKLITKFSSELIARYSYERCLYFLFVFDIPMVRKELDAWTINSSLPYWEAKKASIYAELGNLKKADEILENSLFKIRERLLLTPVKSDYFLVSREAYIMQIIKFVKHSLSIKQGEYEISREIYKGYSERWNTLLQYKCNPWSELKSFEIYLEKEPNDLKNIETNYSFDIGHATTTHFMGYKDNFAIKAYEFLRFIEEIGIPLKLHGVTFGKKASKGAITYLANYSPFWSLSSSIRYGEKSIIDSIYGRKSLVKISNQNADELITKYLSVLENIKDEIKNADPYKNDNYSISISKLFPEILSRLSVKASFSIKKNLIVFLKEVFGSEYKDNYNGINSLTKRLIKSFSNDELIGLLSVFLEFPIVSELHPSIENEYIDPFHYIELSKKCFTNKRISIDSIRIEELFERSEKENKEREVATLRLISLWKWNLLNKGQNDRLGEILWSQTNKKTGFPKLTVFYNYAFLYLPHPESINPLTTFNKYLNSLEIPIHSLKKERGLPLTRGTISYFDELLGTSLSETNFKWEKDELMSLTDKLIKWWRLDKKYLLEKNKGAYNLTSNEFNARFKHLISTLIKIIAPNFHLIEKERINEIQSMTLEFESYNLPFIQVQCAFYKILINHQGEILNIIYESFFSKSIEIINDSLKGLLKLIELKITELDKLIILTSENIRSLNTTFLSGFMDFNTRLIKNYPNMINNDILRNLEIGLTNLISEIEISKENTTAEIDEKLYNKMSASFLLIELKRFFVSKKQLVPEYIHKWEKICLDVNEFSDIRKIWIDNKPKVD